MSDGIGPLTKQVEAAPREPVLKSVLPKSQRQQLPPCHDPVLALRQLRDRGIDRRLARLAFARPRQTAI
jgi:hypothetical protein